MTHNLSVVIKLSFTFSHMHASYRLCRFVWCAIQHLMTRISEGETWPCRKLVWHSHTLSTPEAYETTPFHEPATLHRRLAALVRYVGELNQSG